MTSVPTDFSSRRIAFLRSLDSGQITGGYQTALETVNYVRMAMATVRWTTADELMRFLQRECVYVSRCLPKHYIVTNMMKRVLRLIRDEQLRLAGAADDIVRDPYDSLPRLWEDDYGGWGSAGVSDQSARQLRVSLVEAVHEFVAEIENCCENIAVQALDHINAGDTVMTIGYSRTIERFLRAAGHRRRFKLFIAECAPSGSGWRLAEALVSAANIHVEVVSDAKLFCCMSQTDKVIVGADQVLADGGIRASCGAYALCLCASHFRVPVIVCAAFYKLTPVFLSRDDQEGFNELCSPAALVPFASDVVGRLSVLNPTHDYVPPDLITLLITNVSGNAPSYIYRLINELYHPKDLLL